MGLGIEKQTKDYQARTAATIERTQGSAVADKYRAKKGITSADLGNESAASVQTFSKFKTDDDKKPKYNLLQPTTGAPVSGSGGRNIDADMFAGSTYRVTRNPATNLLDTGLQFFPDDDDDGQQEVYMGGGFGESPTSIAQVQLDDPDFKPVVRDTTLLLDKTGKVTTGRGKVLVDQPDPFIKTYLQDSFIGRLVGIDPTDPIVGSDKGRTIYKRKDGTTYAYNDVGLPYDTVSETSSQEDPAQVKIRESMFSSDDDPIVEEVVEETEPVIDPCPEGYIYNEETMMCEIDPFQEPFADPVVTTDTGTDTGTGVTTGPGVQGVYTQMAPATLGSLTPSVGFVAPAPYATPITVAAQTPRGLASLRR